MEKLNNIKMEKAVYKTTYENERSYWWYQARVKILEHIFMKKIYRPGMEILNLGCGTGFISQRFSAFGWLVSLDLSADALKFCAQNQLDFLLQADAIALPFQDQSFDLCLALDVIEHIQNDMQALSEISRVLKIGGFLLITVPAFSWMWSKMDDLGHYRRYTKSQLQNLLKQTMLKPVFITYYNFFLFPLAIFQRLTERIIQKKVTSENFLPSLPWWLNQLFYMIFSRERNWIEYVSFPFGLSLLAIAQKNKG